MSSKDKLLASAQKNIQKGQIPKAIKDYQQLVALDAKDIRHRQKLAELYSRNKQNAEALAEYETVAARYTETGFYLKAIAVYKQMQKLDPEQSDTYLRLAELNEKQGLSGNALSEYRTLLRRLEKNEEYRTMVGVLQRMYALEPENHSLRVRVGECMVRSGRPEEAKEEFKAVLATLTEKGEHAAKAKVLDFIGKLFGDDPTFKIDQAKAYIAAGDVEKGLSLLQGVLKEAPNDVAVLAGLAEVYVLQEDFVSARLTYQHLLKVSPNDLAARSGYLQVCLAGGELARVENELEQWGEKLSAEGYEELVRKARVELELVGTEEEATEAAAAAEVPPASEEDEAAAAVTEEDEDEDEDVDEGFQLGAVSFATEEVVEETPVEEPVVEDEPVEVAEPPTAVVGSVDADDEVPLNFLEGMVEVTDEPVATEVEEVAAIEESDAVDGPIADDAERVVAKEAVAVEPVGDEVVVEVALRELDLTPLLKGDASSAEFVQESEPVAEVAAVEPEPEIESELEIEPELEAEPEIAAEPLFAPLDFTPVDETETAEAMDEVEELDEIHELEEVEALDEIHELEEVEALDDSDLLEDEIEELDEVHELDEVETLDDDDLIEDVLEELEELQELDEVETLDDEEELPLAAQAVEEEILPVAPFDLQTELEEAEFFLQQGLFDDAEKVVGEILDAFPEAEEGVALQERIAVRRADAVKAAEEAATRAAEKPQDEGFFDLAGELREDALFGGGDAADDDEKEDRFGLDGIFSAFKEGVASQIESDDSESHFNLGIAYKEMGLLDDAMEEFDRAMSNPARRIDALTLKGMCLIEGGRSEEAEKVFQDGIAEPDLVENERICLHYELGLIYEQQERSLEALDCFQAVADVDVFFRDVGEKVPELRKKLGMDAAGQDGPKGNKDRVSYV